MKQLNLPVQPRDKTGRGPARRLRGESLIPAVVYGKSGVRHLTVREPDFRTLMRAVSGTAAIIEIADAQGAPQLSLLQEIQRDSRTDRFVHVDFKEVLANEQMRASVPVHVIGEAIGVKIEGAIIEVGRHDLRVKCLPKDLPDFITVDVSEMHAGDSIHVRDLKPIPGVIFADPPEEVVVGCLIPAIEEEEAPADAAAVPVEGEAGAAPAEGEAAAAGDGKAAAPAAGAKGAAPATGAKGAAPAAGTKGAAPAAKGAAPAAGAKGAAPAAKGAAPAAKPGKK